MTVKTKQGFFQLVLSKQIFQIFMHAQLAGYMVRKPLGFYSFLYLYNGVLQVSGIISSTYVFSTSFSPSPLSLSLSLSLSPSPSLPLSPSLPPPLSLSPSLPSHPFLLTVRVQLHPQHQMCKFLSLRGERKTTISISHKQPSS